MLQWFNFIFLYSPEPGENWFRRAALLPDVSQFLYTYVRKNPPTFVTVNSAFGRLADLGIVEEKTGRARNRVFAYKGYLTILARMFRTLLYSLHADC
jgi:hypothetical protein